MKADPPGDEDDEGRWPVWKLALLLYPFSWGAMAINVFLLGLMWQGIGLTAITPVDSLWLGALVGVPANWFFAVKVRAWMDEADGR